VDEIIVGIDIGTSKVCAVIGKVNKDNQMEILGRGMDSCSGVKKSIIVDIESTSNSIKNSIEQAESMAGLNVASAYVNIAGTHIAIINQKSWVNILSENREISSKDVEKLLYAAGNVSIPEDRQIIDVIPVEYIVDGYDEIIDPVGMVGTKLEAEVDIITGKITSVQNIVKSLERANLKVDGLVVEALATSEIVLTPEEKEMGVILIDIGAGVTDLSVFKNKKLVFYDSIPVGGDHITNDMSIGLKITYSEAEKIKRQYELALTSLIKHDQEVSVSEINEDKKKNVKVSEIVEIIEARVFEIFSLCNEQIKKSNIEGSFTAGVVLTGGGISYVDGGIQLANEVFDMPVRVAAYKISGSTKLEFILSAGIIKYISNNHQKGSNPASTVRTRKPLRKETGFYGKIYKIFRDFFS
jgi:cell division protein FtsA